MNTDDASGMIKMKHKYARCIIRIYDASEVYMLMDLEYGRSSSCQKVELVAHRKTQMLVASRGTDYGSLPIVRSLFRGHLKLS